MDLTSLDLDMAAVCLCRTTLHRNVCMLLLSVEWLLCVFVEPRYIEMYVVVVSGMDFPDMTGK